MFSATGSNSIVTKAETSTPCTVVTSDSEMKLIQNTVVTIPPNIWSEEASPLKARSAAPHDCSATPGTATALQEIVL